MNRDLCCAFEGFIEMLVSKINWEKIFFTAIFKKISFQKPNKSRSYVNKSKLKNRPW